MTPFLCGRVGYPSAELHAWAVEMRELLVQARDSTFIIALPLLAAGALVAISAAPLPDPVRAALCATAFLGLGGLTWLQPAGTPTPPAGCW